MKYFIIFFLFSEIIYGQNLVINSDFSITLNNKITASGSSRYFNKSVYGWRSPTSSTPDIFHYTKVSNSSITKIPNNFFGISHSKSGEGYVGVYTFIGPTLDAGVNFVNNDYVEYVQTKLISPLIKDKIYCIKLYYQLSSYSMYGSSGLGVHIGQKKIKSNKEYIHTQANFQIDTIISERGVWLPMCFEYKALGSEQFLTIGRFIPFDEVKYEVLPMPKDTRLHKYYKNQHKSYFYIDDVYIGEKLTNECLCGEPEFIPGKDTVHLNKEFLIENKDSVELDLVINELKKKLIEQEQLFIVLNGRNMPAKSIKDKLILLGVLPKQIKIIESNNQLTFKLTFEK